MSGGHFQDAERPTREGRAGDEVVHLCIAMDGSDSHIDEVTNLSGGHFILGSADSTSLYRSFQVAERPTRNGRTGGKVECPYITMDGRRFLSYKATNLSR